MKRVIFFLTILLSGCSTLSPTIQMPPAGNLQLSEVKLSDVGSFMGEQVRWGGRIIRIYDDNGLSTLEIQHYPLTRYGFPLSNLPSQGQFIAQSNHAFDPEIYLAGLLITFSGEIHSAMALEAEKKDEYLPIIDISDMELWPHKKLDGKGYTYMGIESEFRGYGIYGSGHYSLY